MAVTNDPWDTEVVSGGTIEVGARAPESDNCASHRQCSDRSRALLRPITWNRKGGSAADHPAVLGDPSRLFVRSNGLSPQHLRRGLVVADVIAIVVGISLSLLLHAVVGPVAVDFRSAHVLLAMIAVPAWLAGVSMNKLYMSRVIERAIDEARRIVLAGAFALGAMLGVAFALQFNDLSRGWITSIFLIVTATLLLERRIARAVFAKLRRSGRINRRVAIIGTDAHAVALLHTVQRNPALGYEVVGFIGDDDVGRRSDDHVVLGTLDQAVGVLDEQRCVGVMISLNSVAADHVNRLTRALTDHGFHVALSTSLRDIDMTRMRPQNLDGQTLIYVEPTIRSGWRARAKRVFDLVVASVALLLAAPLILVAALLIRLESRGPVFFHQQRVGREGRSFDVFKLRTMYVDAEARRAELMDHNEMDGPLFKITHDPRVTRVGRVLRKLSLDELPQFWNVIRGDMSVVGPRPALPDEMTQWDPELHDRLRVLPGITGMWQVSGRNDTSFEEYKRLDLYYVDNWSLLHDMRIVLRTFVVVLLQRGAS
jgi:exopolysaccharide biosynthesis polyprenyl glycosylphosphotransferase